MALLALAAFATAVSLGLSGAVASFAAGVAMSHYTWHSLSPSGRVLSIHLSRMSANAAEAAVYLAAGAQVSCAVAAQWHADSAHLTRSSFGAFAGHVAALAAALLALVCAARCIFVGIAVAVVNLWRRYKFSASEALMLWYSGLPRGSIATALMLAAFADNAPGLHVPSVALVAGTFVVFVLSLMSTLTAAPFVRRFKPPPVQTRLVEMGSLPHVQDEDISVHSNEVRSAVQLWLQWPL